MTQSGIGQQHLNKCAHDGCVCTVAPGQTYCSDFCASVSGVKTGAELPARHMDASGHCDCGHDACAQAPARGAARTSGVHATTAASPTSANSDAKLHDAARGALRNTGED